VRATACASRRSSWTRPPAITSGPSATTAEVSDIFTLQDEVTQQIVRAMAVKLTEAEKVRLGRASTEVLEAYDLVLRAAEERYRTTRESNAEARRLFVRALDLDPNYARAYLGLAWTHLQSWQFLWAADRESL